MSCIENDDYKKEHLEWNKHVPIKEVDGVTFAYFTDDIEIPAAYNEITHRLYNATEDDSFVFVINNGGGAIDSAVMLVDAMNRTPATISVLITGFAASAATIIAMAADDLEMAEHSAFMIHNYSAGLGGKGHELKARQEFMDRQLNSAFTTFYAGFLTEDEITNVIDGKDMWMESDEVHKRWTNRKEYLNG